jgi:hypothetical protein
MPMQEMLYEVRGFLTVRRKSLRAPVHGSLKLKADLDSGLFAGDLVLRPSTVRRKILGVTVLSATVEIRAESTVVGQIGADGRMFAAVMVNAIISAVDVAGRPLISGDSCRTARHAVVPLQTRPGFSLQRGGRVVGEYDRPPFTGCGRLTPVVNTLVAGPGNAVVIDLIPVMPGGGQPA